MTDGQTASGESTAASVGGRATVMTFLMSRTNQSPIRNYVMYVDRHTVHPITGRVYF